MTEGKVDVAAAREALLREIVKELDRGALASDIKNLAVAYRLITGGQQPGSAIVESK